MADFDYNTLNSVNEYVGKRAQSIPKEEADFVSALDTLSKQEQQTRTVTMVAKTAADVQARAGLTAYQATESKLAEADADPFYGVKSLFGAVPDKDTLVSEQQKLAQKIQNISATYNSIAQGQEFKRLNIASKIDQLKTVEAVKSGNVNEMATLSSLKGQQTQLSLHELSKLSMADLQSNVQKNITPYDDGLVEMAYYQRMREHAMASEARSKAAKGREQNNDDFLTANLVSAQTGRALVNQAQNSGTDIITVGGRQIPAGQVLTWAEKVEAPINTYMANRDSVFSNTLQAERSMQEVENLINIAFPTQGVELNSMMRIPSTIDSEAQAVEINTRLAEGLLQMPTQVQSDMARLVNLRMTQTQMRNMKGERNAGFLQTEANLSRAIIDTTEQLKTKMVEHVTAKYSTNKAAASGVNEIVQFGRVTNPVSATAILAENSFRGTSDSRDAAVLGTYYEGSASIIGENIQSQYEEMFRATQKDSGDGAAINETNAFMAFLSSQSGPQGYRPNDSFIVTQAVRDHAPKLKDNAFGKISNVHLASVSRAMAEKYQDIPEIANALIQMQDGVNLVGDLARPGVQTPNLILTTLYKLETDLKAKGKMREQDDLMLDFVKLAQDQDIVNQAVETIAPREEIGLAIDNLIFGGRAAQMYQHHITKNYFTSALIQNIRSRRDVITNQEQQTQDAKAVMDNRYSR